MPPNSVGYLMPSRPRSPIFLKSWWAGKMPAFSHSAVKGLISLATNLRTVSLICSCSGVNCMVGAPGERGFAGNARLHARYAEGVGVQDARSGVARHGQALREHAARLARVDDSVVPQAGGAKQHVGFGVEPALELLAHGLDACLGLLAQGHACARQLAAADHFHDHGGLGATHDGGPCARPGEDEVRGEAAPAHAVVARPYGSSNTRPQL